MYKYLYICWERGILNWSKKCLSLVLLEVNAWWQHIFYVSPMNGFHFAQQKLHSTGDLILCSPKSISGHQSVVSVLTYVRILWVLQFFVNILRKSSTFKLFLCFAARWRYDVPFGGGCWHGQEDYTHSSRGTLLEFLWPDEIPFRRRRQHGQKNYIQKFRLAALFFNYVC